MIALATLTDLERFFRLRSTEEIQNYLAGSTVFGGRKLMLNESENDLLEELNRLHDGATFAAMQRSFTAMTEKSVHSCTIWRALMLRLCYPSKVREPVSCKANLEQQVQHLVDVAPLDPWNF